MMKAQSIAIISHSAGLNGAERCLIEMVQALRLCNPEVHIVVYLPANGLLSEHISLYAEVRVVYLPWWIATHKFSVAEKWKLSKSIVRAVKRLSKELVKENYDLVITNTIATPVAAIAAKLHAIPHVWFIHELGQLDHGYGYGYGYGVSYGLMNLCTTLFLVNSNYVKTFYSRFLHRPMKVVYQPVNISTQPVPKSSYKGDRVRLLMVGRVSEGKGQLFATEVVQRMQAKGIPLNLCILGGNMSDYAKQLQELVANNEQISIVPFVQDVACFYAGADIALVCSRAEAFGRVTIEAMKYGLPVVAADTGATPEIVHDGETGLLYEFGNMDSLEEKITLLLDTKFRKKIANNAYEWAWKNLTIENFAKQLESAL